MFDFQDNDDDTSSLRGIVSSQCLPHTSSSSSSSSDVETPTYMTPSNSMRSFSSRSMFLTSSNRFRLFSQELKADEVAKLRRVSRSSSCVSVPIGVSKDKSERFAETAIAAREMRKRRAMQDREVMSRTTKALKGLRFISSSSSSSNSSGVAGAGEAWREVEQNFDRFARDGFLTRIDFVHCIGMKEGSREFALELFDAVNRRRRRSSEKTENITKDDLFDFWSQITDKSFDSRLQIFFDMVDKNEDGRISESEVKETVTHILTIQILMLSASANRLPRFNEQAVEYAALIMEELDPEKFGYIESWQLEALLQKDIYLNNTIEALPTQDLLGHRKRKGIRKLYAEVGCYLEVNWKRLWVLCLWVGIMMGLFLWKFFQYKNRYAFRIMGYCLTTAKGAAETLKFNMALVLLPVCRNTNTWLRSTMVGRILPIDDNVNFHKIIAAAIVVGIILHAGIHLTCDFPRLLNSSYEVYAPMKHAFGEEKPTYSALLRSWVGVTGVFLVILMSIPFILATRWFRRSIVKLPKPLNMITGFNAFWYSHHLFVIVYILLVAHGMFLHLVHDWHKKTTWMYLSVPVSIYAGERTVRALRSAHYSVHLRKVAIYPGNVLTLQMSKPLTFRYKSGQYTFIQCPDVSPFEWHPFSITSAPSDDYISIHIQQLGDWTKELKKVFSEACEPPPMSGKSGFLKADDDTTQNRFPKLLIDGPYGAPAQDYRKYGVLMLVGLGIGATPFISILKDLLNSIVESKEQTVLMDSSKDARIGSVDSASSRTEVSPKRKKTLNTTTNAYFYWVTREQASFDWFKEVLNEVSELDQQGIIEIHNYLTSVYEEGDARSSLITMVQALNHAKNGVDVVSGTRVRTHFARPNWKNVFSRTCSKHPNTRIGLFFCGTPALAYELRQLCKEYNQRGTTKFEFHKEHF